MSMVSPNSLTTCRSLSVLICPVLSGFPPKAMNASTAAEGGRRAIAMLRGRGRQEPYSGACCAQRAQISRAPPSDQRACMLRTCVTLSILPRFLLLQFDHLAKLLEVCASTSSGASAIRTDCTGDGKQQHTNLIAPILINRSDHVKDLLIRRILTQSCARESRCE